MHIIIPMSGIGKRFVEAGYRIPKPLIVVDEKPIIEHICNLFPDESKFTFICNSKHLAETNMRQVLQNIKSQSNIVEIQNHKKGPVYAVSLVKDLIEDDEELDEAALAARYRPGGDPSADLLASYRKLARRFHRLKYRPRWPRVQ